jgi:hypothetical protein
MMIISDSLRESVIGWVTLGIDRTCESSDRIFERTLRTLLSNRECLFERLLPYKLCLMNFCSAVLKLQCPETIDFKSLMVELLHRLRYT